jgi:hypothetical protein
MQRVPQVAATGWPSSADNADSGETAAEDWDLVSETGSAGHSNLASDFGVEVLPDPDAGIRRPVEPNLNVARRDSDQSAGYWPNQADSAREHSLQEVSKRVEHARIDHLDNTEDPFEVAREMRKFRNDLAGMQSETRERFADTVNALPIAPWSAAIEATGANFLDRLEEPRQHATVRRLDDIEDPATRTETMVSFSGSLQALQPAPLHGFTDRLSAVTEDRPWMAAVEAKGMEFLELLPEPVQNATVDRLDRIQDEFERAKAMGSFRNGLEALLPAPLLRFAGKVNTLAGDAWSAAIEATEARFLERLPERLQEVTVQRLDRIEDESKRAQTMVSFSGGLKALLPTPLQNFIGKFNKLTTDEPWRAAIEAKSQAFLERLPEPLQAATVQRLDRIQDPVERAKATRTIYDRRAALQQGPAFQVGVKVETLWNELARRGGELANVPQDQHEVLIGSMEELPLDSGTGAATVATFVAGLPHLVPDHKRRLVGVARRIQYDWDRASALAALAERPADLGDRLQASVLDGIAAIKDRFYQAQALRGAAKALGDMKSDHAARAVDLIVAVEDNGPCKEILNAIGSDAATLPDALRQKLIDRARGTGDSTTMGRVRAALEAPPQRTPAAAGSASPPAPDAAAQRTIPTAEASPLGEVPHASAPSAPIEHPDEANVEHPEGETERLEAQTEHQEAETEDWEVETGHQEAETGHPEAETGHPEAETGHVEKPRDTPAFRAARALDIPDDRERAFALAACGREFRDIPPHQYGPLIIGLEALPRDEAHPATAIAGLAVGMSYLAPEHRRRIVGVATALEYEWDRAPALSALAEHADSLEEDLQTSVFDAIQDITDPNQRILSLEGAAKGLAGLKRDQARAVDMIVETRDDGPVSTLLQAVGPTLAKLPGDQQRKLTDRAYEIGDAQTFDRVCKALNISPASTPDLRSPRALAIRDPRLRANALAVSGRELREISSPQYAPLIDGIEDLPKDGPHQATAIAGFAAGMPYLAPRHRGRLVGIAREIENEWDRAPALSALAEHADSLEEELQTSVVEAIEEITDPHQRMLSLEGAAKGLASLKRDQARAVDMIVETRDDGPVSTLLQAVGPTLAKLPIEEQEKLTDRAYKIGDPQTLARVCGALNISPPDSPDLRSQRALGIQDPRSRASALAAIGRELEGLTAEAHERLVGAVERLKHEGDTNDDHAHCVTALAGFAAGMQHLARDHQARIVEVATSLPYEWDRAPALRALIEHPENLPDDLRKIVAAQIALLP